MLLVRSVASKDAELLVLRQDVAVLRDLNHVHVSADGIILGPIRLRLAHPPEFDLMARIAGLRLRERWGGWNGEPYTATSWRHIRVYEVSRSRIWLEVWGINGAPLVTD